MAMTGTRLIPVFAVSLPWRRSKFPNFFRWQHNNKKNALAQAHSDEMPLMSCHPCRIFFLHVPEFYKF